MVSHCLPLHHLRMVRSQSVLALPLSPSPVLPVNIHDSYFEHLQSHVNIKVTQSHIELFCATGYHFNGSLISQCTSIGEWIISPGAIEWIMRSDLLPHQVCC